jgi:ADP-heptose:LPS heptosyltransferase
MQISAKFLIIRFSSIGDIVLTTPVLRCLKEQFDGKAEIHYLTKKNFFSILENNPHIDKLHGIENSTNEIIEELIAEDFDFVIDLHKNLRSLRVKRKLKLVDFSFNKLNIDKWLMVSFKIDRLPKVHIVDRYMETVKSWEVKNDLKGLDFHIDKAAKQGNYPFGIENSFIAMTVGGGHTTKTLPTDRMITLIEKLPKKVVMLGGEEDREKADLIEKACGDKVFNACGKYSLNESAYIVQNASLVIAHDTGLMHIASAFSKHIISIWGNTIPEFGMYPYMPQCPERSHIVQVNDLSCRPCSKLGYDRCPKKHFKCMNDIDLDEVVEKAAEFLLLYK